MSPLRVLVADDNQEIRIGYERILETGDGIEVIWMASDGNEALVKTIELAPDVAILDVRMPEMDGLAAANRIKDLCPQTAIILVSAYDELAFVRAIMHSGPTGRAYLLKNSLGDAEEFLRVVEAVAKGQAVLHESIIQNLMVIYHRLLVSEATHLSDYEERILKLMLSGLEETQIASTLGLPYDSVESIAKSLCARMGVDVRDHVGRSPLVVKALVDLCVPGTSSSSSILGGSSSVSSSSHS